LTTTNKIAGVVLDLRFVGGDDAASAQATANLFASKKIVAGSLVVLVNGETRGVAETLAAALRHAGAGLIIGTRRQARRRLSRNPPAQRRTAVHRDAAGQIRQWPGDSIRRFAA